MKEVLPATTEKFINYGFPTPSSSSIDMKMERAHALGAVTPVPQSAGFSTRNSLKGN